MMGLNKELKKFGLVKVNFPLAKVNSFKIGGLADFFVRAPSKEKLVLLLNFLIAEGIDYLILGGGFNVLLPDEGFRGVVVQFQDAECLVGGDLVEAGAGASLGALLNISTKNGLTDLEWLAGIPGTVGGAIRGNAGARYDFAGGEIGDSLVKAEVWRNGEVLEISNKECEFGYRDSIFKHNSDVILRAWFKVSSGDRQKSLAAVQEILRLRGSRHSAAPSAGSFFKNVLLSKWPNDTKDLPENFLQRGKIPAGWLIDQTGARGFAVGGAMVSNEHGNFIINFNQASQADILAVVEEVRERVYNKFGVELEEEVQIIK